LFCVFGFWFRHEDSFRHGRVVGDFDNPIISAGCFGELTGKVFRNYVKGGRAIFRFEPSEVAVTVEERCVFELAGFLLDPIFFFETVDTVSVEAGFFLDLVEREFLIEQRTNDIAGTWNAENFGAAFAHARQDSTTHNLRAPLLAKVE